MKRKKNPPEARLAKGGKKTNKKFGRIMAIFGSFLFY
jgi:hypothetical protein